MLPEHALLQAEQPNLSQPYFTGAMLQPLIIFVVSFGPTPTDPCPGARAGCSSAWGFS